MGQPSLCVCNLIWVSRAPPELKPALCFYAGIFMQGLFAVLVRKERKRKRERRFLLFACVLVFKVMYFYNCWFFCVGGQVWVSVCLLLVQCQGEVQVGALPGPARILHPRSPVKQLHTSIRENPQLWVPLEQVCELTVTSDDCHVVTGWPPVPGACSVYNRSTSRNKW